MKTALWIIRWIVGLLFIFSGLIKVNDPMGLSYKMQEFFEVLNLHFLNNYALVFSLGMNVFEVLAGVAVIIGWRMKLFSWLLLILIVFFTFLTGFALFSGKIKTCGCFGDCIPLTAAQSFGKDLILLLLIFILVIAHKKITPSLTPFFSVSILVITIGLTCFLQLYVLQHLPFVDCLPFKKGKNIIAQMKMPEGATLDSFSIQF
ncbi:MAG: DoxX family protein, partial [Sphingobacteriia bacterium]